ncbi:MAG TPA: hypothetical protein DCR93_17985 [Cytophagales bacterium]|nr:hypothetical protein [Cytophagales bacterium]HAP61300.1 hypothetical protein [Cytophagales bacterium]
MKRLLNQEAIITLPLKFIAEFGRHPRLSVFTAWATRLTARLVYRLVRPQPAHTPQQLAEAWIQMMPARGLGFFTTPEITEKTAYAEIHVHCPLRDTGNVEACYRLMNYDRQLMDKTGGQLVVLESQANSGKPYCRLALRAKGEDISDLVPAHWHTSATV